MSTSRTPDPGDFAELVGASTPRVEDVRVRCAQTMAAVPALLFLTYLDGPEQPARYGRGEAGDLGAAQGPAADFVVLARALTRLLREWDEALQEVGTGRLIRAVLRTEKHALCYDAVRPGVTGFLGVVALPATGASEDAVRVADDTVRAADVAVADLADHFRALDGMPAANHGGYKNPYPGHGPEIADAGTLAERLRASVGYEGLHFASCWADDVRLAVAHCFDDARLAGAGREDDKIGMTPPRRFAGHVDIAARLGAAARDLKTTCGGALQGKLNLIVLDVEDGAVFYARLGPRRYLTTVTLVQSQIEMAAETTGRLLRALRPLQAGGRAAAGNGR